MRDQAHLHGLPVASCALAPGNVGSRYKVCPTYFLCTSKRLLMMLLTWLATGEAWTIGSVWILCLQVSDGSGVQAAAGHAAAQ